MGAEAVLSRFFREDRARLLAWLIRVTGDFQLAEDALMDACATALDRWPTDGVPDKPAAWLATAAKRRALDRLRRSQTRTRKAAELAAVAQLEQDLSREPEMPEVIPDERLRLVFTCCHPALAPEAQVALTLRTLCGLTTDEIARAFLLPRPTLQQRLVRAQQKIRDAGIPYEVPDKDRLPERLQGVLATVYLVFNESYSATSGPELVRTDLADEAIRLARLVHQLLPEAAEARGLLALLLLTNARRSARVDQDGVLITLEHQDRSLWNQTEIDAGRAHLQHALRTGPPGPYQLQAAIAAVHGDAATAEATDWAQIVSIYDVLAAILPTPVVALNRAAAVAMAHGPELGLALLDHPSLSDPLARYLPYHAARADLLRRAGRLADAAIAYQSAIGLSGNSAERRYLERRLAELTPL